MKSRKNGVEIISMFKKQGLSSKTFKMKSSADFDPEDAEWNYKDIVHAAFMHSGLKYDYMFMDESTMASLGTQKIFFFNISYVIFHYDLGPNQLIYFTRIANFYLVVEIIFTRKNKSLTEVVTSYSICANKLFLSIFFPFIKWAITRNYNYLMVGDMEMRVRKGWLRKLGITFAKEKERYTFAETAKINRNNCVYKPSIFNGSQSSKVLITKKNGSSVAEFLTGISDPWGLRGVIVNNKLFLYPRMCDHEGACLDNANLNNNIMSCPWHGKKTKAIHEENVTKNTKFILSYNGKSFSFTLNDNLIKLIIT